MQAAEFGPRHPPGDVAVHRPGKPADRVVDAVAEGPDLGQRPLQFILLAYRGAFDESTPGNGKPLTGADLRAAIELVLADKAVPEPHRARRGCSIK
jgi:hypothetical protein